MTSALIIVDVQNDFAMRDGALSVPDGLAVILPILDMEHSFDHIVKTRDAHPAQTSHFDQWPVHCVEGTEGAELVAPIRRMPGPVFDKGTQPGEDAYSGFDGTDLNEWLSQRGVDVVVVVGLALDYCVRETALDAQRAGYSTTVLLDATRAVTPATGDQAITILREAGVEVI